jgi:type I restriction enzyme S subunit
MKVELSAIKELTEELPSNWEGRRLKYVSNINFSNVNKKTEDGEKEVNLCNYVDVYYNDFITSELAFMKATATDEEIRKFLLHKGNVLITKDSETADDIGIPAYVSEEIDNLVCGYHLAILRAKKFVDGRYLFRFLQSKQIAAYFETRANGITRYAIGLDTVGGCPVLFPPLPIQKDIATFLDKETARIDALIEKKNRQIELLQEKRQAVITRAITKGFDPNAKMKDSGIEWIGEIPEEWRIWKIAHGVEITGSGTTPPSNEPEWYVGAIPWITTGELKEGYINSTEKCISSEALENFSALKLFPAQSLVIAMYGATIGRVAITQIQATTNQACCVLCGGDIFSIKYLFYWFQAFRDSIILLASGGGQPNISQEKIRSLRVPCPSEKEQEKIVQFIEKHDKGYYTLSKKIEASISLLQKYLYHNHH